MTEGPDAEKQQPSNKEAEKHKVAKTLLEINIEGIADLAEKASRDQANGASTGHQGGAEPAPQSGKKGDKQKSKVAKTLLEVEFNSLDKLGASLLAGDGSPAPSEQAPAQPSMKVSDQISGETSAQSSAQTAAEPKIGSPGATGERKQPRRLKRLSRTLLEFPLDDLNANRLTEPSAGSDDNTKTNQCPDNNFVSPIIGGMQTQTQPTAPVSLGAGAPATDLSQGQSKTQIQAQPDLSAAKSAEPRRRRTQHFVAKTMLDHSVLFETVAKSKAKMEAKVVEKIHQRLLEPVKPCQPIECNRKATKCAFKWDDPEATEKFRICTLCQTPVYNFNNVEMPEAEAIIFKRENIKHPTLYKREDGKYMTRDCPREAMRRQQQQMMILVAATVVVAVIALMIMFPPPPPKPAEKPPEEPKIAKPKHRPSSVTNRNGTFHYEAGKPAQEIPATGSNAGGQAGSQAAGQPTGGAFATFPEPSKTPAGSNVSPGEESGQFWQYADGQNGGNNPPSQ